MTEPPPFVPRKSLGTWLFNPFYFVAGGTALAWGLGVIVVAALIGAFSHSHFDGVLDFHTGLDAPVWAFVAEAIIDWLCLSVFLYLAGLALCGRRVRAIDVFGTQALARCPTLVLALIALLPGFQRVAIRIAENAATNPTALLSGIPPADLAMFFIAALMLISMIVWMVALMYRSYAVSCNIKGAKAVVTFIVALLLAEVVSKVVLIAAYSRGLLRVG